MAPSSMTLGAPRVMQRSQRFRSSGLSAGRSLRAAAAACSRFWASAVSGGMCPSGGSTTSDVRRVATTLVPLSHQKSLYARATSASPPPSRRSRLVRASVCRSNSAASCSEKNPLPARIDRPFERRDRVRCPDALEIGVPPRCPRHRPCRRRRQHRPARARRCRLRERELGRRRGEHERAQDHQPGKTKTHGDLPLRTAYARLGSRCAVARLTEVPVALESRATVRRVDAAIQATIRAIVTKVHHLDPRHPLMWILRFPSRWPTTRPCHASGSVGGTAGRRRSARPKSAREARPEAAYACRSVRMGSTFAARAAGIHAASRHTATIRPRLPR